MKSAKCRPPTTPYHKKDFKACTKTNSFDPLFMENVHDIADTMAEIMIVCGIHRCKAKRSRSISVQAFQFYDTERHQFQNKNVCGIRRVDMLADFRRTCFMDRFEALLAYCIIKRAVKAFYHGTPDYSLRSPVNEAVILKEQQFVWQHAAKRTIQKFERDQHMFFNAQSNYAEQIVNIYNALHGRLKSRADPVVVDQHHPQGCIKKIIVGTKSPPKLDTENRYDCVQKCQKPDILKAFIKNLPIKTFPLKSWHSLVCPCSLVCNPTMPASADSSVHKRKTEPKNVNLNLPRCYQCNCPKIICDCEIKRDTGVVAIDCSQGPFECQWVLMNKREKSDPCIEKKELHQCPVDCPTSESSSESDDCECCQCSDKSSSEEYNEVASEVDDELEKSDNDDTLNSLIPSDFLRSRRNYNYEMRTISKLPPNRTRATLKQINKK